MEETTGVRAWFRSKAKMITVYAAMFSAVLGTAVAYNTLDLPWFASDHDVEAVYQEVASNTKLILGQEWERLRAKIYDLRGKLTRNPTDRDTQEDLARAEAQLREVETKLKK